MYVVSTVSFSVNHAAAVSTCEPFSRPADESWLTMLWHGSSSGSMKVTKAKTSTTAIGSTNLSARVGATRWARIFVKYRFSLVKTTDSRPQIAPSTTAGSTAVMLSGMVPAYWTWNMTDTARDT